MKTIGFVHPVVRWNWSSFRRHHNHGSKPAREICAGIHTMGAPSFSPYLQLLELLFLQVDTKQLQAMMPILSPAG
jgi:hypothetical protein